MVFGGGSAVAAATAAISHLASQYVEVIARAIHNIQYSIRAMLSQP